MCEIDVIFMCIFFIIVFRKFLVEMYILMLLMLGLVNYVFRFLYFIYFVFWYKSDMVVYLYYRSLF